MSFLEKIGEAAIGVGVYTLSQAARLARLRLSTVEDLVGLEGAPPRSAPVVLLDEGFRSSDKVLSFLGLLELYVVAEMRADGVPLPTIRRAAFEARRILEARHPLASANFRTDGRRVFMTLQQEVSKGQDTPKAVLDLLARQQAFEAIIERTLHAEIVVRGPDGAPLQWYPIGVDRRVVLDPGRRFGEPIDPESGVPTSALAQALRADGGDKQSVAFWFGVDEQAVADAAAFEAWLARA